MLSVGRVAEYSAMTNATAPKSTEEISAKKETTLAADNTDKFVKSGTSFTPAYTKATVTDNKSGKSRDDEAADKQEENPQSTKGKEASKGIEVVHRGNKQTKNELMKDMVSQMLTGQVSHSQKNSIMKELDEILKQYGADEEAEKEEDYWGAEKTANRILDFAKSLAGDDADALETLRGAFEKGFGEIESLFGGKDKLPSVSYDTYDLVQKGFDDWAKELSEKNTTAAEVNAAEQ